MADIPFNNVIGAGGGNVTAQIGTYDEVSPGSSGTIITIPAVAGQRAVLTYLASNSSVQESGITVMAGSRTLISGGTLDDAGGTRVAGTFFIGQRTTQSGEPAVISDIGESITVTKDTGNTVNEIGFSFSYII